MWVGIEDEAAALSMRGRLRALGHDVAGDSNEAPVAIVDSDSPLHSAQYTIAVAIGADSERCRKLARAGFDDILAVDLSEPALTAALVMAEVRAELQVPGATEPEMIALNALPDMILVTDVDTTIRWVNAAVRSVLGFEPGDIRGKLGITFGHPDDVPSLTQEMQLLLNGEAASDIEVRLRRADGDWAECELSGRVLTGLHDAPTGLVIVARTIKKRAAIVRSLRESEERLRTVVETSPDLISILDASGRFVFANATHLRVLGYGWGELEGTEAIDLVHPEDRESVASRIGGVLRGGSEETTSARLRHKLGHWVPFEVAAGAIGQERAAEGLVVISRDLTERHSAAAAARALEERFRLAFHRSPVAMSVRRMGSSVMLDANEEYVRLLGYGREELIGRSADDLRLWVYPEERAEVVAQVTATSRLTGRELHLRRKDGRMIEARASFQVLLLEGEPVVLTHIQDVTEEKAAEAEKRRLSTTLSVQLEASRDGIIIVDTAQRALFYNSNYLGIWGLSAEDVEGGLAARTAHVLRLLADPAGVTELMLSIYADPAATTTHEIVLIDGRHLDMHTAPLIGPDGTIYGRAWQYRDITVRRNAEERLRASEDRYRNLVESSPDATIVATRYPDGSRILFANAAAALLLGAESGEAMTGHDWSEFVAPLSPAVTEARRERLSARDVVVETDPRYLIKRDTTVELEIKYTSTHFEGVEALQVVIRDMSDRRRAEEERLTLERKLLETQKLESLGVMAGGIAHDFNNLLVAIMGNASLAIMTLPEDSPAADYIRDIELASQRAADLARQMLAYSGKGRFTVAWTDIGELVHEMGNLLGAALPKKVRLQYQLAEGLPLVQCDATQIRQVVMNLVINGGEAIGDHDGVITVTTREVQLPAADVEQGDLAAGRHVCFEVADTGSGMDEATRMRIFEPFFTTKFTGRGLGLAAVSGIARGHGGAISVESTPGVGTTFRLLLPAGEVDAHEHQNRATASPPAVHRGTVLVIDDEESVRQVAAAMLRRLGYQVLTAAEGGSGMRLLEEHADAITAVLVDMVMPGSDGEDVQREVRARYPGLPVVIMSGFSAEEVEQRLGTGVLAGFLQKPFRMADLAAALDAGT